jgi:hypothetical protein
VSGNPWVSGAQTERRVGVVPCGIEVQDWMVVETLTFPTTAGAVPLALLLGGERAPGSLPTNPFDDEPTLEIPVERPEGQAGDAD